MAQITRTKTGYRVRAAGVWRERPDGSRYRDRKVIASHIPTLREAKAIAAKETSPDYIAPHQLTCRDLRESYVQSKIDAGKSRSHTRDLESTLRVWWSAIDHISLQQLAPDHIEDIKRALVSKRLRRGGELVGLSHRQQVKVFTATKAALTWAVRQRRITWNPADACDPPAPPTFDADAPSEDIRYWEPETSAAFQTFAAPEGASDDEEFMLRTAVCLNLHLGLRPGELAALRWSDRAGNAVRIRRSNSMVGGLAETELKDVKTRHGRRDVGMSSTADKLWKALQARQRVVGLDGYVFSPAGPIHPQRIIDCFERLRDDFLASNPEAQRIVFYDTRHTAITGWVRAGIAPEMVHKMAGHGSYGFTISRYFRPTRTDAEEAAAKLG